jgi:hypothetical protein
MNDIQSPSSITRRSFIKRSVVAAVAVSSMTIFSGLVNAANGEIYIPNGCSLSMTASKYDLEWLTWTCEVTGDCDELVECGQMFDIDPQTLKPARDAITNEIIWRDVTMNCRFGYAECFRGYRPPLA